jgi:predicted HTH domain antitoxin
MENNEENQVVLNFSTGSMKMLKEISVKENIPIDKMIEDLVERQIKRYEMQECAQKYLSGQFCVAEAAHMIDISVFELMDFIKKEKYKWPIFSRDELTDTKQEIKFKQV